MKKIINNPADVVPEMVNGMVRLYPQYIEKIDGTEVMVRSDKESMQGKVGIVSGGGSGHEPSHAGFVGKGMLSTAIIPDGSSVWIWSRGTMHRHRHEKRRNGLPFPKFLPGWRAMSRNGNKSACPP